MAHGTLHAGKLTAVIGDNAAEGEHRAGYNGVWSLVHESEPDNLFVPRFAGLNLEHIFDGNQVDLDGTRTIFFEPRHAPMTFHQRSEAEAELHQPPTPTFHLESWTRFRLVPPHYLDMTFRCIPRQHAFGHGYIGLFWASYVNGPDDKSFYFRRAGLWEQFCTQEHYDQSTLRHEDDRLELKFRDEFGPALFRALSPLRYDEPFYYGRFRDQAVILMFDRTEGVRFTHSPTGGGLNRQRATSNPAWDFQYILPDYDVNREYSLRCRLVYRPRCPRSEILDEVTRWHRR